MTNHLGNMITEEVKTVVIGAIIGVVVEVIIADEDDVGEAGGEEVEFYEMDI